MLGIRAEVFIVGEGMEQGRLPRPRPKECIIMYKL